MEWSEPQTQEGQNQESYRYDENDYNDNSYNNEVDYSYDHDNDGDDYSYDRDEDGDDYSYDRDEDGDDYSYDRSDAEDDYEEDSFSYEDDYYSDDYEDDSYDYSYDSYSSSSSGAWMIWPSYTDYLSSPYGYRVNPVSGIYKLHAGVDIAASYGTNIYAAASGTVILAGDNGGYGNCVMINHGNGYTTLYGHMSSIAVYDGQSVSQGDTIGYVGSTGNSTGPHLHFEVRDSGSGETMDPMGFSYY